MSKYKAEQMTVRVSSETRQKLEKVCEQYEIPLTSLVRFYINYGLRNVEILDKERAS